MTGLGNCWELFGNVLAAAALLLVDSSATAMLTPPAVRNVLALKWKGKVARKNSPED